MKPVTSLTPDQQKKKLAGLENALQQGQKDLVENSATLKYSEIQSRKLELTNIRAKIQFLKSLQTP